MKAPLMKVVMLCRLVRGFCFSTPSAALLSREVRPGLPQQRQQTAAGSTSRTGMKRTAATSIVSKMVLRPDWEREGKVFGLRLPPSRKGERAFEYLVDYPCEFEIKVIGINEGSFADDIAATVSAVCQVCMIRFHVRGVCVCRAKKVVHVSPPSRKL